MRVITLNCNGIRSASDKGLWDWVQRAEVDVLCLQEVRANVEDVPEVARLPKGFHVFYQPAQKKGYSGVAIYSRHMPSKVQVGFGVAEFDDESRYLELGFAGLRIASVYVPSGSSSPEAQEKKNRFIKAFTPVLTEKLAQRQTEGGLILCGDWNVAHKEIDLKNWKGNKKNSGFLPEERQWLTDLFTAGYVDVFRTLNPLPEQYTWWSNRGRAWDNNVGWRIDYQLATPEIAATAEYTRIYKDHRFSDHAPLIIDYDHRF